MPLVSFIQNSHTSHTFSLYIFSVCSIIIFCALSSADRDTTAVQSISGNLGVFLFKGLSCIGVKELWLCGGDLDKGINKNGRTIVSLLNEMELTSSQGWSCLNLHSSHV